MNCANLQAIPLLLVWLNAIEHFQHFVHYIVNTIQLNHFVYEFENWFMKTVLSYLKIWISKILRFSSGIIQFDLEEHIGNSKDETHSKGFHTTMFHKC